jgi:hypothetical protein
VRTKKEGENAKKREAEPTAEQFQLDLVETGLSSIAKIDGLQYFEVVIKPLSSQEIKRLVH